MMTDRRCTACPCALLFLWVLVLSATSPAGAASAGGCAPTRPDMEGPFYKANAPERASTGRGLVISGMVRSASGCGPLPGARIEWWAANPGGEYDEAHRATQRSDGDGRYRYETDFPGRYPGRPLHVHVRVTAPGHRALITQLYPVQGQTSLAVDLVLIHE
ncbi:MAG TPA: intradiol ring-cleavage dioxygenase [Candidatus Methylomirabilis sp.]|nr:intradiol ring-cleavage dioxygenase [Candidatus Methylomirabilis sp.]